MIRIARLKPWTTTTADSLRHQFQQRCAAGGTAKGKAKIKAGITLKRSKITTKKSDSGKGGRARGEERQRHEALLDQCLNGPAPLRHLTPKLRAREGEREKMGLISKERQREIDMLKKGKEALGVPEKPAVMGTAGMDLVSLGVVDVEAVPKYQLRVEDGRDLAKEYSRVLMRQLRARQGAESELLRLKSEAVEALPQHLKEAAMVPDFTPFPANRFMATLTPPIEGYIEKVMEASKKSSGTEKLR